MDTEPVAAAGSASACATCTNTYRSCSNPSRNGAATRASGSPCTSSPGEGGIFSSMLTMHSYTASRSSTPSNSRFRPVVRPTSSDDAPTISRLFTAFAGACHLACSVRLSAANPTWNSNTYKCPR